MFANRREAGKLLGRRLAEVLGGQDAVVLALPRGGVPVGYEVARQLKGPLYVYVVRKIGVPGQEELAMGAIASGGVMVRNASIIRMLGLSERQFQQVAAGEAAEIARRERMYGVDGRQMQIEGKICVVVDDGIATGATMRVAVASLRKLRPSRVIVGAPVASMEAVDLLRSVADQMIILAAPSQFMAVGAWYENFDQTTDEEVRQLLAQMSGPLQKQAGGSSMLQDLGIGGGVDASMDKLHGRNT